MNEYQYHLEQAALGERHSDPGPDAYIAVISIAISMKRIADALTGLTPEIDGAMHVIRVSDRF